MQRDYPFSVGECLDKISDNKMKYLSNCSSTEVFPIILPQTSSFNSAETVVRMNGLTCSNDGTETFLTSILPPVGPKETKSKKRNKQ